MRFETRGDDGRAVPVGEEGEVAIASPTAIRAYDGNPEANRESFRDGFYLSGDLGRIDEDGYLTLTGRKKFLINRAGYKINPVEIEELIRNEGEEVGDDADGAAHLIREQGGFPKIREDLRCRKALDAIVADVKRIPVELAAARDKLWTPEKEKGGSAVKIWTPGSEENS